MRETSVNTSRHAPSPPKPNPLQDRASPAVPENIAQLLYVVSTLLEYGRHLAATIERRAAMPGFSLFAALFGTAKLRVILAHLHRGILRATALENLLLRRAATGRDVAVAPLRVRTASNAKSATAANSDPVNEPLDTQISRLAADRARHDAPIDPDHLPTLEEIEAEVSHRPYGRTITDICRDLGIVPGLCTRPFWDSVIEAIACYEGSVVNLFENTHRKSGQFLQEQENDPESKHTDRGESLYPHQTLGFKIGEPPIDPFRDIPMSAGPRNNVSGQQRNAAAPARATGPPHAPMQLDA